MNYFVFLIFLFANACPNLAAEEEKKIESQRRFFLNLFVYQQDSFGLGLGLAHGGYDDKFKSFISKGLLVRLVDDDTALKDERNTDHAGYEVGLTFESFTKGIDFGVSHLGAFYQSIIGRGERFVFSPSQEPGKLVYGFLEGSVGFRVFRDNIYRGGYLGFNVKMNFMSQRGREYQLKNGQKLSMWRLSPVIGVNVLDF